MPLHPRIADRIAANLAAVRRRGGEKAAAQWWGERFPQMIKTDYDIVVQALNRRAGKKLDH